MLIELEATTFRDDPNVLRMCDLINKANWSNFKVNSPTRTSDELINISRQVLGMLNRGEIKGMHIESICYQTKDRVYIGACVKGMSMTNAFDKKRALKDQLFINYDMVVYSFNVRTRTFSKEVKLFVPYKQRYKEFYFTPEIFDTYVKNLYRDYDDKREPLNLARSQLEGVNFTTFHRSILIAKHGVPSSLSISHLNDFILSYGGLIQDKEFILEKTPMKYIISDKFLAEGMRHIEKGDPYFIFKHVWRCWYLIQEESL